MPIKLPVPHIPSRLSRLPDLGNHTLELSDSLRLLLINKEIPIRLTPTEYRIVKRLLATPHALVDDSILMAEAFQCKPFDQQANLDRHIDELRRKFRYSGLAILRVVNRGWLITEAEAATAETDGS
jgi:DNA-binding response OmpR family regulator